MTYPNVYAAQTGPLALSGLDANFLYAVDIANGALSATAGGTADALTATYSPAPAALVAGLTLYLRAASANATTTPQFSPNGLTGKIIVKNNNQALAVGDIAGAGHWLHLVYDATNGVWELINPATFVGAVQTGGTANGVAYLNASKVLTTGTAITFDGTNFATTGTASATKLIPTGTSVTGNGLYLPAANALGLSTNGTNAVYIDASQNVGIGVTPSTWTGVGASVLQIGAAGASIIGNSATIDVIGNAVYNSGWKYATTAGAGYYAVNNGLHIWYNAASGTAGNAITFAESMRIDSSGNLLVGATATSSGGKFLVAQPTAASQSAVFQSTNATAGNNYGILINYTVTSPNGISNSFVYCSDSTQLRAEFRSNGGLANFSANNVNLSDARTKTDIQDSGSYLHKICAIPVRTFKYKDQTDDLPNLGCIAQEVETVAPELVDVSGFGITPDDGIPLKAIYQTDLQYALMKCIQEQQALITALTARITVLEAK